MTERRFYVMVPRGDLDRRTIHAQQRGEDDLALCEWDGPRLPPLGDDDAVLDLSHPETTPADRARVDCPGCLEWLHA